VIIDFLISTGIVAAMTAPYLLILLVPRPEGWENAED
jgi:hypothetical protein